MAELGINHSLRDFLREKDYHPLLGARNLKRLIEKRVAAALAVYIIEKGVNKEDELVMFYDEKTDLVIVKKSDETDVIISPS